MGSSGGHCRHRKRLDVVARDLVKHFEDRQSANYGKGMIVCMSRRNLRRSLRRCREAAPGLAR